MHVLAMVSMLRVRRLVHDDAFSGALFLHLLYMQLSAASTLFLNPDGCWRVEKGEGQCQTGFTSQATSRRTLPLA